MRRKSELMSCGDNGCIPIRFDCDPPRVCRIDVKDGNLLDKAEFVEMVEIRREIAAENGSLDRQH